MKNTNKTTPVVKREQVVVKNDTPATPSCECRKSNCLLKTVLMASSIWGSALIIAGAILVEKPQQPLIPAYERNTAAMAAKAAATATTSDATIKKYIESNPKVILDAVNSYVEQQRKQAEEEQAAAEPQVAPQEIIDEIVSDKSNYSLGNPNGKYVIIEFFDHNCGWCKRTNAALREALAKPEAKNIRWIPIDTPIFGEGSELIAHYVLAAGKQGKYAEMHEAVSTAKQKLNKEGLVELGKKLGLNTDKLVADAEGAEIKAKMEANQKYAQELNIHGVPMLIVNGKINPGALFGERLDAAVAESQNVK